MTPGAYTRRACLWSLQTFAEAVRAQGDEELADALLAVVRRFDNEIRCTEREGAQA